MQSCSLGIVRCVSRGGVSSVTPPQVAGFFIHTYILLVAVAIPPLFEEGIYNPEVCEPTTDMLGEPLRNCRLASLCCLRTNGALAAHLW